MNPKLVKALLRIRPVELAEFIKKLLRVSRIEAQIGTLRLWLDPASNLGSQLLLGGAYEVDFTERLSRILRPGDVFLDVGANEAYFSLLAAEKVGDSGHVYLMEPQARLWPVILFNFLLNWRTN